MVAGFDARLKQIVRAALDLPDPEREAYVNEACASDADLRAHVESMLFRLREDTQIPGKLDALDALLLSTVSLGESSHAQRTTEGNPARIGRYPVVDKIGAGGMGIVYRALDPKLDREIAIKTLPPSFSGDPDQVARFRREARMLAALNHPSVTTIYSIEEFHQGHFLTMEYVPGRTLAERIASAPMGVEETLRFGRQIATALEAAHERGVIHRDLKPLNVMVTPDDTVKVLDFGLARPVAVTTDITATGQPLGTPGYMSPEQLLGSECDGRADIWAFGCLLYACLAGRSPFWAKSPAEAVVATLQREPDLDALPASTPSPLRKLVEGCLAKSVESRLDRMSGVRRAIDELIAGSHEAPATARSSVSDSPHNLRHCLTDIIGREEELRAVSRLMRDHRMVTLTGVGGTGKTRLALEVAWNELPGFPDGVWFVELGPLSDADLVPTTVMGALALGEEPGATPLARVINHAKSRRLLIVLDNCEHLAQAVAGIADALLGACPTLSLLASSREPLGIEGERVFSVPTLPTPSGQVTGDLTDLAANPAVRLFMTRTRAVQPSLELIPENASDIAEICRRLDGIPLALELAAARTRVLSVEDLSQRLDHRFEMLTGGFTSALPHHQTLRGLIEWSYELLDGREQAVFRRLSVFAGGWTLEAAESICGGETIEPWDVVELLSHLVEKSLVERDTEGSLRGGRTRFRMLETIREYARDRLEEAGEAGEALERHRSYYRMLAGAAAEHLRGRKQSAWLKRLAADHENLLQVCEGGEGEKRLRPAVDLSRYWLVSGHWTVARGMVERGLAELDPAARTRLRAEALSAAGLLTWRQGDGSTARERLQESLSTYRELELSGGIASVLGNLGQLMLEQGEIQTARTHFEESLSISREAGNPSGTATALGNLGLMARHQGNFQSAWTLFAESLSISRELDDRRSIALALGSLGSVALAKGDLPTARTHHDQALAMYRELGDRPGVAIALLDLATVAHCEGDDVTAQAYQEESLSTYRALGDRRGIARTLVGLGAAAQARGDVETAIACAEESLSIFRDLGHRRGAAIALNDLGAVAYNQGDHPTARARFEESLSHFREIGDRQGVARVHQGLGSTAAAAGDWIMAQEHLGESLSIFHELGDPVGIARVLESLGILAATGNRPIAAVRLLSAAASQALKTGDAVESPDATDLTNAIARTRSSLGDQEFEAEWAAGQALSMDDAIGLAREVAGLDLSSQA